MREVREEIGVTLDLNGVRPHYSVTYGEGFDDWYVVKSDPDIESLELQYEEVQAVRWASEEEVHDRQRRVHSVFQGLYLNYIQHSGPVRFYSRKIIL